MNGIINLFLKHDKIEAFNLQNIKLDMPIVPVEFFILREIQENILAVLRAFTDLINKKFRNWVSLLVQKQSFTVSDVWPHILVQILKSVKLIQRFPFPTKILSLRIKLFTWKWKKILNLLVSYIHRSLRAVGKSLHCLKKTLNESYYGDF